MLIAQRRRPRWKMLLYLLAISCTDSYLPLRPLSRAPSRLYTVSNAKEIARERFHEDMRRVLQSRRHFLPTCDDRRQRPQLLDSDVDGALRATAMLQHLKSIGSVSEESFQIVMQAFLRRGRLRWQKEDKHIICAADQIEVLLEDLREYTDVISVETYNIVLETFAVCSTPRGDRRYGDRALALLDGIRSSHLQVPVESLLHVLHALCWQQPNLEPGNDARQAAEIFEEIKKATSDTTIHFKCLQYLLEAWSKSGTDEARGEARRIFREMRDLVDKGAALLDAEDYTNIILSWSKSSEEDAAEVCDTLLMDLIKDFKAGRLADGSEPTLIAFNAVMGAWARIPRPDRAEKVLRMLEDFSLDCTDLSSDVVSYNSVLQAHLRNRDRKAGLERAIDLVSMMEERSIDHTQLRPNAMTLLTLMKCWLQSGHPDAPDEARRILQKMEIVWNSGDTTIDASNRPFNMVINAYAKSRSPGASQKAIELYESMKASDRYKPDIITVTSAIEALSKSSDLSAPDNADTLLREAFEQYSGGDMSMKPNLRTFTVTILTFSKNQGDIVRARALLVQLVDLHETTKDDDFRPNEYPYNYVISCAANSIENKVEAFQIAARTYQEMRKSSIVNPDSFTYAFWFKSCNKLLPQSELKEKCISHAFAECTDAGLLTKEAFNHLIRGNPPMFVSKLLGLEVSQLKSSYELHGQLPPDWSRNIPSPVSRSKRNF